MRTDTIVAPRASSYGYDTNDELVADSYGMGVRLFNLLLSALLAGPLSLSAWAVARPENRVGGAPVFSSDFASQETAKPIVASGENPGCGYDFALGVHKYLYTEDDFVNHIDPTGHDLAGLAAAIYVNASLAAMSLQTTVAALGGVGATVALLDVSYNENLSSGSSPGVSAAMAGINVLSFGGGEVLEFPAWATESQLKTWVEILFAEHNVAAPASEQAMAAAIQFSEEIVPNSIQVGKIAEEGTSADIVAQATVNGTVRTLKREVSVFHGDLTKAGGKGFYDKILDEAAQTQGAQIKQVFIQITDNVRTQPNWQQIIAQKVQSAKSFLGDVQVYVVDSAGRSVLR